MGSIPCAFIDKKEIMKQAGIWRLSMNGSIHVHTKQYCHPPHFPGKETDLPEGHTEFWIWVFYKNPACLSPSSDASVI